MAAQSDMDKQYLKMDILKEYFDDEMTRYGFIAHMEAYIKQLLSNPKSAKVDEYLLKHNIDSPKALSLLLKRQDPNDETSAILIRTEKIRPEELSEEDKTNGVVPKDKFVIKYKLPRKDYMKKMRNLYINTFESHIIDGNMLNEMNANTLDSKITKKENNNEITYEFGKNGWGLSDELIKIGKDIKKLSKNNNVYIDNANIDSLDDVYDLTVSTKPITEGAWGTGILDNDQALDYQTTFGKKILNTMISDIENAENVNDIWAKLGVLIDFLKKYKEDELIFSDAFSYSIDFAKNKLKMLYHNNVWLKSWQNKKDMKKTLKKMFNDLSDIKYRKEIMPTNNGQMVTEEEGGGATSADASGQFVQPLFGGKKKKMSTPITRTIYLTQEQVNKLRESVVMDTPAGDFGYDAPAFSDKETTDHKNMIKKSTEEYKWNVNEDSGIHIDPENKGKFNATKKRTGKSTEELAHSKNPLTRKRAQFALNVKKWNKK